MASQENANNRGYAFLENCSIEELERLLGIAVRVTPVDEGYLAALEAAILRRESSHPTERLSNADRTWDKFRNNYLAEDVDRYELSTEVEVPGKPVSINRRQRGTHRVRRALLIAAVIVVLLTLLLPPVLGYRNIIQMVAQWTGESFSFAPPSYGSPETAEERNSEEPVTPLMESLEEHNLPLSFAPKWFPEDRYLSEVQFDEYESGTMYFTAIFTNEMGEELIYFDLTKNSKPGSTTWEKDDGEMIEFSCNGFTHYIMTNNGLVSAAWYVDPFEISVSGHISVDEAKTIIKSIYKR